MSTVHINAPRPVELFIRSGRCLDCKKFTRFIGLGFEWYGSNQTCLRCGREWNDGQWNALPSHRYARRESVENAKKVWRRHLQARHAEVR